MLVRGGPRVSAVVINMKPNLLSLMFKRCVAARARAVQGLILSCLMALSVSLPAVAATEFQLNFDAVLPNTRLPNALFGSCGQSSPGVDCTVHGGNLPGGGGTLAGNDGSPFMQEELTIDGTLYFHVLVGDPTTGFANESYTRAALTSVGPNTDQVLGAISPFSQDSGGNEINVSTSALNRKGLSSGSTLFGNARDPFGVGSLAAPVSTADSARISGSGTGDPSRTVMRMTLSDSQMVQEVNKPLLDRKPLISQVTTDNATMTSEFQADLRGLTYTQKDRNTPIVNKLTLTLTGADALPVDGAADFDMTKVQRSTVTAGKFAYTAGSGWNSADGWAHQVVDPNTGNLVQDAVFTAGTYSGEGNGFDPLAVNWADFFSPTQNAVACSSGSRANSGICP